MVLWRFRVRRQSWFYNLLKSCMRSTGWREKKQRRTQETSTVKVNQEVCQHGGWKSRCVHFDCEGTLIDLTWCSRFPSCNGPPYLLLSGACCRPIPTSMGNVVIAWRKNIRWSHLCRWCERGLTGGMWMCRSAPQRVTCLLSQRAKSQELETLVQ